MDGMSVHVHLHVCLECKWLCQLCCVCECTVAVVLRETQVCVREGLDCQLLSRWNVLCGDENDWEPATLSLSSSHTPSSLTNRY